MTLFKNLFEAYYTRHALVKCKDPANVKYWGNRYLARWGDQDANAITRMAVQDWVDELGQHSPSAANRAVHQMAAIYNWSIRRGRFAGTNPCIGVEKFDLHPRERFLMPDEMKRFITALNSTPPAVSDLFWILLLTGARRANVLAMRWDEIDTSLGLWQIPHSKMKNDDAHVIPLAPAALAILDRRRAKSTSPWVFPGKKKDSHFKDPRKQWQRLCEKAGVQDLNIHDLRRTLGSYMAINGVSLPVIGKVLGHKDQRSTAVYAKLHLAPVKAALDDAHIWFR